MGAIRRRPLRRTVQQSRVPLGVHHRLYRRRRCFTVSISPRATLKVGWEVRPSLSVSQNGDRAEVLHAIQAYFGCGSIRPDRSDKTLKWETRRLEDILDLVVPHFEVYPLLSGKRRDYERFAAICTLMARGAHRRSAGLVRIVELARMMNPSGRRRYEAEAILAKLRQGEGIVCASGNGGENAKFRPARMA
jgi:hypothetical protein